MITNYWSSPTAAWVLFCGNAVMQSNHGFIFIHILFFHLVTWNPAIFLSSVWRIATGNKPCIKSQTTKAPWKPPIHYQTLWVEWLVTFKKWNLELAFFGQISSLQKWPWKMPLWSLGSQQGKVTPFPTFTFNMVTDRTPKKNIQNVPTHAWFWGCRIWGLRMGNSGLSWQVRI